jgi:ATP-dependent DNA helicase RecG
LPEGVTEPRPCSKGQISVLRNPDIAHALYLRGLMEKAGRGSVLMVQQCQDAGLPAPAWKSDPLGVTVTFEAPSETPHVTQHVTPHVAPHVTPHVRRLLQAVQGEKSRAALMTTLKIKDRVHFADTYLRPALEAEVVEMTQPDKPRSVNQRYRLTALGKSVLNEASP